MQETYYSPGPHFKGEQSLKEKATCRALPNTGTIYPGSMLGTSATE